METVCLQAPAEGVIELWALVDSLEVGRVHIVHVVHELESTAANATSEERYLGRVDSRLSAAGELLHPCAPTLQLL